MYLELGLSQTNSIVIDRCCSWNFTKVSGNRHSYHTFADGNTWHKSKLYKKNLIRAHPFEGLASISLHRQMLQQNDWTRTHMMDCSMPSQYMCVTKFARWWRRCTYSVVDDVCQLDEVDRWNWRWSTEVWSNLFQRQISPQHTWGGEAFASPHHLGPKWKKLRELQGQHWK